MSAPSAAHERRRAELNDLAMLAGYGVILRLAERVLPDVARTDGCGGHFVGDAKSTESPGCTDTFRRLARYARYMAYLGGNGGVVALAVPAEAPLAQWSDVLEAAVRSAGLRSISGGATVLGPGTAVVHVRTRGRTRL